MVKRRVKLFRDRDRNKLEEVINKFLDDESRINASVNIEGLRLGDGYGEYDWVYAATVTYDKVA